CAAAGRAAICPGEASPRAGRSAPLSTDSWDAVACWVSFWAVAAGAGAGVVSDCVAGGVLAAGAAGGAGGGGAGACREQADKASRAARESARDIFLLEINACPARRRRRRGSARASDAWRRSEEHTSELQSL